MLVSQSCTTGEGGDFTVLTLSDQDENDVTEHETSVGLDRSDKCVSQYALKAEDCRNRTERWLYSLANMGRFVKLTTK